jgi:hypothetical protein
VLAVARGKNIMKITRSQLKRLIKEELTRALVLQEVEKRVQTSNRIDEGFISDMSKKFGLSKKAILAMLVASTAAGAISPSQALANDDMFSSMLDNALDQTADEAASDIDKARSLELGKEVGKKIVELLHELLQAKKVDSNVSLILDTRVGPIDLVRADGGSYQEGMAATIKQTYSKLEIDTDTSYTRDNVPKGTLVIQVDLTPNAPYIDVVYTIVNSNRKPVVRSQSMQQKI